MKLWKRNAVIGAIVLFVCAAVYLNWSYNKENSDSAMGAGKEPGKTLGQAALVGGKTDDPLLGGDAATGTVAGEDDPAATTGGNSYFDAARLNRQQSRDNALSLLQQAAAAQDADQTMKDEANASIQTMASLTVDEAQIENLIVAKGYTDCVAFIGEKSVSVVVAGSGEGLTDADVAKISEIVTEQTGFTASQINIVEAVQ